MKTSANGRKFIEAFEGLALKAYWDATGKVWTIGYGHTSVAGPPRVYRGMVISKAQADQILGADLASVEIEVAHIIKVPLNQAQFDSLVSFQYNVGALGRETCSLTQAINAGKFDLADMDFSMYDRSGGQVLAGLQRRRHGEAVMFAGNVEEALQIAGAQAVAA